MTRCLSRFCQWILRQVHTHQRVDRTHRQSSNPQSISDVPTTDHHFIPRKLLFPALAAVHCSHLVPLDDNLGSISYVVRERFQSALADILIVAAEISSNLTVAQELTQKPCCLNHKSENLHSFFWRQVRTFFATGHDFHVVQVSPTTIGSCCSPRWIQSENESFSPHPS